MRILFLQKVDNARGGIANVNTKLIEYFLSLNYHVDVVSIRHGDTWEEVNYPDGANNYLINDKDVWGCPRLREIAINLKKAHLYLAMQLFFERIAYKKKIKQDYLICQKRIEEINPDVIINSHYEILDGISERFLKRTIMHFHTSFDQVLTNSSYLKIFKKYASKIYGFVWLSKQTCQEAISNGFVNSRCIYNPLMFSEERCADIKIKKILFIGRMAEEKRVHLAIEYFSEVVKNKNLSDWIFEIYGDGELSEQIKLKTQDEPQILYKGRTNKVNEKLLEGSLMILTSSFEGMPLVVLEANECGVPVIAYDFGESSQEVILNKKTGIIVKQNDKETFMKELEELLEDESYRRELSVQAKQFAKKFAVENIGNDWLDLFEEMKNSFTT